MTQEGIGWVTQVQMPDNGEWLSWTQWRLRKRAEEHVRSLLSTGRYAAGRVVRVDWTVVEEVAA